MTTVELHTVTARGKLTVRQSVDLDGLPTEEHADILRGVITELHNHTNTELEKLK